MPRQNSDSIVVIFAIAVVCWVLLSGGSKTIPKTDPKIVPKTNPKADHKPDYGSAVVESDKINEIDYDLIENDLLTVNKDGIIINTNLIIGNIYYMFVTETKVNWYEAAHYCRRNGAHLESIESIAEMQDLSTFLRSKMFTQNIRFWTSGNDLGTEGAYYCMATGQPMSYFQWDENEPNNYAGEENCISLHLKNREYRMTDLNCMIKHEFICKANIFI